MLPSGEEIFLDHIAHFVPDVDAARAALARAGFAPTPVSIQTDEGGGLTGTGNTTAMLADGYIEVLFKTAETKLARELDSALARYAGIHLVAFAVADARDAATRLAKAGFRVRPVVELRRKVDMEEGTAEAAFTVTRVEPGEMREGRIQFLTHHTEAAVWQTRWLSHPNGARALLDVVIAVSDIGEAAERFARFLGRPSVPTAHGRAITLDRGSVQLLAAASLADFLPGAPSPPFIGLYAVRVESLAQTRSHFAAGRIETKNHDGALLVRFPQALGQGAWLFVENPRDLPWRRGS